MPGIDETCKGPGATHFACDCVCKQLVRLEKAHEIMVDALENWQAIDYPGWAQDILIKVKKIMGER